MAYSINNKNTPPASQQTQADESTDSSPKMLAKARAGSSGEMPSTGGGATSTSGARKKMFKLGTNPFNKGKEKKKVRA